MLKFVAIITVDGQQWEYYGENRFEFGIPGEKASIIVNEDVLVEPIYRFDMWVREKELPIKADLGRHYITLDSMITRGGEAEIFQGTLDGMYVVWKRYYRGGRRLRLLPSELREYLPRIYLICLDAEKVPLVAMEPLLPFSWSPEREEQCIQFIDLLEELGEVHKDLSPGNLMMDRDRKLKVIDFGRKGTIGTPFYSKMTTDRQAMARSLLKYKYNLSKLQREDANLFDMLLDRYPEDYELIEMAR